MPQIDYGITDTIFIDSRGNQYPHLAQIPDSLYTPEQQTVVNKISEIISKNIIAKDNRMVLILTKEDFIKTGLPIRYYKILTKNIQDNNHLIDTAGIDNIEALVEDMKADIDRFKTKIN